MKRMNSAGFTIVETMLVLAVSGAMFVAIALLIQGQQNRAQFKMAMTDITSQIQQQINEVSTGFFPNTNDYQCTKSGSGGVQITDSAGAQGTNANCIILGRALMFGIPGGGGGLEEYRVQTLVGVRTNTVGREVATLQEAQTRALAPGVVYGNGSPTDRSITKWLLFGSKVAWMQDNFGNNIAGIAFVTSPNGEITYGTDSNLQSGLVTTSVVPILRDGSVPPVGVSPPQGADLIARTLGTTGSPLTANMNRGPVSICIESGTTGQSGLVLIGSAGSNTSIETEIFSTNDCT